MNLCKISIGAILAALSSATFAAPFDGFFAQGLIGYQHNQASISNTMMFDGKYSKNSTVGQISFGASQAFGKLNIAASTFMTIGQPKIGEWNYGPAKVEGYMENTWGVAIEPGMNISESTLVYAKLGYAESKIGLDVKANGSNISAGKENASGFIYGVGGKKKINDSLYAVAEIQQINFNNIENAKVKSFGAYAGIGMNF